MQRLVSHNWKYAVVPFDLCKVKLLMMMMMMKKVDQPLLNTSSETSTMNFDASWWRRTVGWRSFGIELAAHIPNKLFIFSLSSTVSAYSELPLNFLLKLLRSSVSKYCSILRSSRQLSISSLRVCTGTVLGSMNYFWWQAVVQTTCTNPGSGKLG